MSEKKNESKSQKPDTKQASTLNSTFARLNLPLAESPGPGERHSSPERQDVKEFKTRRPPASLMALTSGPLSAIYSFLDPKELAPLASVSKSFLSAANEMEAQAKEAGHRVLSFAPGRNDELTAMVVEKLRDSKETMQVQQLQRLALQPGYQATPRQRRLFLAIRGEILAGKMSLQEVLDQIQLLSNKVLTVDQPLARLWLSHLEPWRKQGAESFTLSELYSDWISYDHVKSSDRAAYFNQDSSRDIDSLPAAVVRGLQDYQVLGLVGGYTEEAVRADWFTPLHAEASLRPYSLQLPEASSEHIFRLIMDIGLEGIMTEHAWRARFTMPYTEGVYAGVTPIFMAAAQGYPAILEAMWQRGHYNVEEWEFLMTEVALTEGTWAGRTAFEVSIIAGRSREVINMMFRSLQVARKDAAAAKWRALIERPISSGPHAGLSLISVLVKQGAFDKLNLLRDLGNYSQEQWRVQITRPLVEGIRAGETAFFHAIATNDRRILESLHETAAYTRQEWRGLFEKPLRLGPSQGMTPLYVALINGHKSVIDKIRSLAAYTQEELRALLEQTPTTGAMQGQPALYTAASSGNIAALRLIREMGRYTGEEWADKVKEPLTEGPATGRTAIYAAAENGHAAAFTSMVAAGGFSPERIAALITAPIVIRTQIAAPDNITGQTPFYAAAAKGHIDVLEAMVEACHYPNTKILWRNLIHNHLKSGPMVDDTPFYAALRSGNLPVLELMRQGAEYSLQGWRDLFVKPILGYKSTILVELIKLNKSPVLEFIRQTGEYTQPEWNKIIQSLSEKTVSTLAERQSAHKSTLPPKEADDSEDSVSTGPGPGLGSGDGQ